jgi:FlaA1/EpsC-like NDP-sugar epimerase
MSFISKNVALKEFFDTHKWQILGLTVTTIGLYITRRYLFAGKICKNKTRLDGKTVIITGANAGIGYETAMDLAKRGARVIMACRNIKNSIKSADIIRQKSGNGNVITEYLDLASLESVKKFATKINEQEEKIDILINNAGV